MLAREEKIEIDLNQNTPSERALLEIWSLSNPVDSAASKDIQQGKRFSS
jgi:hypothetical protein